MSLVTWSVSQTKTCYVVPWRVRFRRSPAPSQRCAGQCGGETAIGGVSHSCILPERASSIERILRGIFWQLPDGEGAA